MDGKSVIFNVITLTPTSMLSQP